MNKSVKILFILSEKTTGFIVFVKRILSEDQRTTALVRKLSFLFRKKRPWLSILLFTGVTVFGIYLYILHNLAVAGNKIFAYRCTDVNPHLIGYKNSFLQMADYFNDPRGYAGVDVETAFKDYNSGLKTYVEAESKWLEMQKTYMDRWDFGLIEPWYIKRAAVYQWKMYEGYRDDARYLVETYNAGGLTEEIDSHGRSPWSSDSRFAELSEASPTAGSRGPRLLEIDAKFTEARNRRDKYEGLYHDFFDEALAINDWRKFFVVVPIPEGCNEENITIPNTSGSVDWDGKSPTPIPVFVPIEEGLTS